MPPGSRFRKLWALDPDTVYLNHGSFGACPRDVLSFRAGLLAELEAAPMEFLVRRLPGLLQSGLEYAEKLTGAEPGSIAFVPNATHGVNTALASFGLRPGDEVLVGSHEYFSTLNACMRHCAAAGARCRVVPMPFPARGPEGAAEAFLSMVTPATRLAVIDHVTSSTGFVQDPAPLVAAMRGKGVEVLVDGAHGPGMVPLDMQAIGAAFYTGNFHKWLCSPKVCAMLYVRPDMQERTRPLATSHVAGDFDSGQSAFRVEFQWSGTPDPTAALCVSRAGEYLASLLPGGLPAVMEANRNLVLEARGIVADALGVGQSCPDSMTGAMASFELPWIDPPDPPLPDWIWMDPLQRRLLEECRIEVPVSYLMRERLRILRISAQLYNDISQYEYLASCLRRML
ncbi:MAG TPA: aminotransferase class V-fold PLP-dependent enzyme [Candidatus Fermentibacter sp.]|nr:aminotransferase class V-fold PLP-dependent enzyme [Candidatus Fermentibacter sp.]